MFVGLILSHQMDVYILVIYVKANGQLICQKQTNKKDLLKDGIFDLKKTLTAN